jgi:hypothetical protein
MAEQKPGVFGQYALIARIGQGGMGETWKARRRDLQNAPIVVIKRILPQYASDPDFVSSFVAEAHVTASLDHPNVAHILDFGRVKDEYFFAIEFVHGRTIEGLLECAARAGFRTLPIPVACYLAIQMLEGLGYAHSRSTPSGIPLGIVHRDISPDNVLVGFDGQVKVVDFGVAKSRLTSREETQSGLVKGKWPYFSPEQARGESLDGRSDLFAVGVTLYRMLCGRLPFEGAHLAAVYKMLKADFVSPRLIDPSIPTVVVDAIERALEVNREKRFQSAAFMQTGLRTALDAVAPDFGRAELRGYVQCSFEDQLAAEGLKSRISATDREVFAHWRSLALPMAGGTTAIPERTAMRGTVLATRGLAERRPRPRPLWLLVAGMFGLGVALALGAWVALRPQPAELAPASDERLTLLAPVFEAFEELERLNPDHANAFRDQVVELRRMATSSEPPGQSVADRGQILLTELAAQLRYDRAELGREAGVSSQVVVEAPATASDSEGAKDEVALGAEGLKLSLSFEKHNLVRAHWNKLPSFENKSPRSLRLQPGNLIALVTLRAPPGFAIKQASEAVTLPGVLSLRFLDFRPYALVPPKNGLFYEPGSPPPSQILEPLEVSRNMGGFIRIAGVGSLGDLVVAVRRARADRPFEVVSSCDEELRLGAANYPGPVACCVALVAPPDTRGTVEVDLMTHAPALPEPEVPSFTNENVWKQASFSTVQGLGNVEAFRASQRISSVTQALKAMRERKYAAAEAALGNCPTNDRNCDLLKAIAISRQGQLGPAISAYKDFVRTYPTDPLTGQIKKILASPRARAR